MKAAFLGIKKRLFFKKKGNATILALGMTISALFVSPFAIDLPAYFTVQQQLQNAVDAGALAGAAQLPISQSQAQQLATQVATQNMVQGKPLAASALTFKYSGANMSVTGQSQIPSITAGLLCALTFQTKQTPTVGQTPSPSPSGTNTSTTQGQNTSAAICNGLTASATAQASPTPRDTMLVIDTSSSMNVNGTNKPFSDVQNAALNFLATLQQMNSQSIDKVGLVSFDETSIKQLGLSSPVNGSYAAIDGKIQGLHTFVQPAQAQFNTNYHDALQAAITELNTNGRSNSFKTIIFLTDGHPNLTDANGNSEITPCVINYYYGQYSAAKTCTINYVNSMTSQIIPLVQQAQSKNIKISTIQIGDINTAEDVQVLQALTQNSSYLPLMQNGQTVLNYMATQTNGGQYYSASNDPGQMNAIYQQVAQSIKVKLSG